jgi:hypothetical protein
MELIETTPSPPYVGELWETISISRRNLGVSAPAALVGVQTLSRRGAAGACHRSSSQSGLTPRRGGRNSG